MFFDFLSLFLTLLIFWRQPCIILFMLSLLTLLLVLCELGFPTLMLCIVYPFSHKAALFWSDYITQRSARMLFSILGKYRKFDLIGDEESKKNLPSQFIVISNHQSLLDIVVYLVYFADRVRFVAKDSLNSVPMVGKMLRTQGHCMIPRRGSPSVAMKSIDKFGKRMLDYGKCPVIFPEGTRSRDGNLGTFYAAGFRRLCEATKLPVVLCALDGGWKISSLDSIFTNLYRGAYRVKVLKVYDSPGGKEEQLKILQEAPELIEKQLEIWRKNEK